MTTKPLFFWVLFWCDFIYQSSHLVAARAAVKLTDTFTIYSTRISNEPLVWGPSGQTFSEDISNTLLIFQHFTSSSSNSTETWSLQNGQVCPSPSHSLTLPVSIPCRPPSATPNLSVSYSSIPHSHCLNPTADTQGRVSTRTIVFRLYPAVDTSEFSSVWHLLQHVEVNKQTNPKQSDRIQILFNNNHSKQE